MGDFVPCRKGRIIMTTQLGYGQPIDNTKELQILDEHLASKRERKRAVRTISLILFAITVFDVVSGLVISAIKYGTIALFGYEGAIELFSNYYFSFGAQVLSMYVCAFPIFFLILKRLPKAKRKRANMSFGAIIAASLIIYCITNVISPMASSIDAVVSELLSPFARYSDGTSLITTDTPIFLIIAIVVIIGPIIEELMFRKIIIDRLSIYGDKFAVAVSAITFGIFHGNITQLLYTVPAGIIFAYAYVKTRKIIYPIMLHIIMNFLGSVPALLVGEKLNELFELIESGQTMTIAEQFSMFAIYLIYIAVHLTLIAAGGTLLMVLSAKKKISFPSCCDVRLKKRTVVHALFFTIGAFLFAIAMLYNYASSFGIVADYVTEILNLCSLLTGGNS